MSGTLEVGVYNYITNYLRAFMREFAVAELAVIPLLGSLDD